MVASPGPHGAAVQLSGLQPPILNTVLPSQMQWCVVTLTIHYNVENNPNFNFVHFIFLLLRFKVPWSTWILMHKGAVHKLGGICPRSDPDIAHMGYYPDLFRIFTPIKKFPIFLHCLPTSATRACIKYSKVP